MKLEELVQAFAMEMEHTAPQMDEYLTKIESLPAESDDFLGALDDYSGQAGRMGEAAEMVGLTGLQMVCNHIVENTLMLASLGVGEREASIDFLRLCTPMMISYLHHIEDPQSTFALIELIQNAPHPMATDQLVKVTYELAGIPQQLNATPFEDENQQQRPVLAKQEDIDFSLPTDLDESLINSFLQEAPMLAKDFVQVSSTLLSGKGTQEDIAKAKRIAHTLKGSSATVGIRGITVLNHHLEDILEHFEKSEETVPPKLYQLILDAAYCIEQIVDSLMGNDSAPENTITVLQAILDTANRIDKEESLEGALYRDEIASGKTVSTDVAKTGSEEKADKPKASNSSLRIDTDKVDKLFKSSGEVMVHGASVENHIKSLMDTSKQLSQQNIRIQKRLFELEGAIDSHTQTLLEQTQNSASKAADFDALEMHEYNELHSVTNALIEDVNDSNAYLGLINNSLSDINGVYLRQQQSMNDLQYLILSTRMSDVGSITSRLQRNIRNTCQSTGKQAELVIKGGDTLIDSHILSKLTQPLMHLLRNAVDHGIELPELREQSGKKSTGTITLAFARKGQQVEMTCKDDGKGLDYGVIYSRAVEKGIISPDEVMTNDEIAQLIFHAGFSTKDAVSEISGRGVGMDVVREWVQQMNGSIRVNSVQGAGSTITMTFAASMSTSQTLIIRAHQQKYAIPYTNIKQVLARGIGETSELNGKKLFHFNDMSMNFGFIHDYIGCDFEYMQDGSEKPLDEYDIVIANINGNDIALAVDELISAKELLVKNPKRYAPHVSGVSGMSILGNGELAINLDLATLINKVGDSARGKVRTKINSINSKDLIPHVLIVDDALSVRNSLKQFVEDIGMVPITARDGMEAIERLEKRKPDMVLTDLEMPNLNGVELTSYIRNQDNLKDLPVIMITSRSQAKHRELADEAGVDDYLTKPYNDSELLSTIHQYTHNKNSTTA